jgi:small subunit ribosomal protein S17
MEQKTAVLPTTDFRQARKVKDGRVVSDKMDKTRVVLVSWNTTHPRYHKVLRRVSRFYAHDEKNESHVGDRVEIMETKPLSKLKRWRVTQILEKAVL